MRRKIGILLLTTLIFTSISFGSIFYMDTINHWAEDDILYASNNLKLFYGYEDATFHPDDYISRAEFIALINRALIEADYIAGEKYIFENYEISEAERKAKEEAAANTASGGEIYQDLSRRYWGYQDVVSLHSYLLQNNSSLKDVFKGEQLNPSAKITRFEAAKLMSLFVAPLPDKRPLKPFLDFDEKNEIYIGLTKVVALGIFTGFEDNTLRLAQGLTRAEAATLLKRFYAEIKEFKASAFNGLVGESRYFESSYPFFSDYGSRKNTQADRRYKKAVISLEYLSVVKKIPYSEKNLYDVSPYDTLRALLEENYFNKIGLYYYLMGASQSLQEKNITRGKLEAAFLNTPVSFEESRLILEKVLTKNIDEKLEQQLLNQFEKSIASEKNRMDYMIYVSRYLIKSKRYEEALQLYQKQSAFDSLEKDILFQLNKAYLYYIQERYQESEQLLREQRKILSKMRNEAALSGIKKYNYAIRKNMMQKEIMNR